MPNYTKNYNLKKPLQEEFYNIDDHNENMDILDETLKELSEKSGVIISADEPETGDVWIDTDDESGGSGGGGAVSSVNGKTGDVYLEAEDVNAIRSINGINGADIELTPEDIGASSADHNHPASKITAGTFAGQVVANAGGQLPSTYLVRNSKISATAETPTVNGQICWQYV